MNMQRAKVFCKFLLLLRPNIFKVLSAKHDHSPLGNEQRKFVLLRVIQLRELQASNFSANHGSELGDLQIMVIARKESRLGLVRRKPTILEFKWLDRLEVSLLVINREILMISVLWAKQSATVLSSNKVHAYSLPAGGWRHHMPK